MQFSDDMESSSDEYSVESFNDDDGADAELQRIVGREQGEGRGIITPKPTTNQSSNALVPLEGRNNECWLIHFQGRAYARGRRERRNRFRPADVAFFSSERDKNVALIFRKIRCFNIHFNIHTCHRLVYDLGRSSTRYASGFHKKSIRARGPVWEGS